MHTLSRSDLINYLPIIQTLYTLHTTKEITATGKFFVVVENKTWFSEGVVLHCGMSLYRASRSKRNVGTRQVSGIYVYREFTVKKHMLH